MLTRGKVCQTEVFQNKLLSFPKLKQKRLRAQINLSAFISIFLFFNFICFTFISFFILNFVQFSFHSNFFLTFNFLSDFFFSQISRIREDRTPAWSAIHRTVADSCTDNRKRFRTDFLFKTKSWCPEVRPKSSLTVRHRQWRFWDRQRRLSRRRSNIVRRRRQSNIARRRRQTEIRIDCSLDLRESYELYFIHEVVGSNPGTLSFSIYIQFACCVTQKFCS